MIKRNKKGQFIKGQTNRLTHGMSYTLFWKKFQSIKQRCNWEKDNYYYRYGGRGIKCLWNSFEEFKGDMYDSYIKHCKKYGIKNTTIERIDNNKNYSKENCHWATAREQANNRINNHVVEYNNKKYTLAELARELNINYSTLRTRLFRGMCLERAVLN